MLPVTHGEPETRRQILLYSIVLVAATLVVAPLAGLGVLYRVAAAAARRGVPVRRRAAVPRAARRAHAVWLFRYSILYLFVLFLVMTVDAVLRSAGAR